MRANKHLFSFFLSLYVLFSLSIGCLADHGVGETEETAVFWDLTSALNNSLVNELDVDLYRFSIEAPQVIVFSYVAYITPSLSMLTQ